MLIFAFSKAVNSKAGRYGEVSSEGDPHLFWVSFGNVFEIERDSCHARYPTMMLIPLILRPALLGNYFQKLHLMHKQITDRIAEDLLINGR